MQIIESCISWSSVLVNIGFNNTPFCEMQLSRLKYQNRNI